MTIHTWDPSLPVAMLLPSPEGLAVALQPVDCVARDFVRLMFGREHRPRFLRNGKCAGSASIGERMKEGRLT